MNFRRVFLFVALTAIMSVSARERLQLAGQWKTQIGECTLPGTTDQSHLGNRISDTTQTARLGRLFSYRGEVCYERDVIIPKSMAGRQLRLLMERTKPSTLYVDGNRIGSFTHLQAPHEYFIPPLSQGEHHFRIVIDNGSPAIPGSAFGSHALTEETQTNWNGIVGEFFLESLPDPYVKSVQVYPDGKNAEIRAEVISSKPVSVRISATATLFNCDMKDAPVKASLKSTLESGSNIVRMTVPMGDSVRLWSEFHPALYRLSFIAGKDRAEVTFGMRDLKAEGRRILLNGNKLFLRGTHTGCVFPMTGFPPMDVDSWRAIIKKVKSYGLNHYRCHSWAPPKAALDAADLEGFYFQCELPLWGSPSGQSEEGKQYYMREGKLMLDYLGNSPSFLILSLGNEINGEASEMKRWVECFRNHDPKRHLYAAGTNAWITYSGQDEGADVTVTMRIVDGKGESFPVRASFAFLDEGSAGTINAERPRTDRDFYGAVNASARPLIGHETGQYQFFPDYSEISKYKGVLYPYNLMEFHRRFKENGLGGQEKAFSRANGALAVDCYKEEIEYFLRTKAMSGFQILDIMDFPGQGTALVGILDAFMDNKGHVSPEEFSRFCSPLVPLAGFKDFCWYNDETFKADLMIANFTESSWNMPLEWTLTDGKDWKRTGIVETGIPQGEVENAAGISASFHGLDRAVKLRLTLRTGTFENGYDIWVFPRKSPDWGNVTTTSVLTDGIRTALENGAKVLYVPSHESLGDRALEGMFIPDFWNWGMFMNMSVSMKARISPGTLGYLVDTSSVIFREFPSADHISWQWWSICHNTCPMILDGLKGYRPIVQAIDNIERNHRLGVLFEFSVGKGKLLVSMSDLNSIAGTPEGDCYVSAIYDYIRSDSFKPDTEISWSELKSLFE